MFIGNRKLQIVYYYMGTLDHIGSAALAIPSSHECVVYTQDVHYQEERL